MTSSGTYYLNRDGLGSVVSITDSAGAVLESYEYTTFGLPTIKNASGVEIATSTIGNAWMFTGRMWDDVLQLYDYRARVYNPKFGVFYQTDPLGYADSTNMYAYCVNDPVNMVDPYGEAVLMTAALAGALFGIGFDYYLQYKKAKTKSFTHYYKSGEYSTLRALGQGTLGAVTTAVSGAIGALSKVGIAGKAGLMGMLGAGSSFANKSFSGEQFTKKDLVGSVLGGLMTFGVGELGGTFINAWFGRSGKQLIRTYTKSLKYNLVSVSHKTIYTKTYSVANITVNIISSVFGDTVNAFYQGLMGSAKKC